MTTGKFFERPRRLTVVLGGDTRLSARGDSNLRKNRTCPAEAAEGREGGTTEHPANGSFRRGARTA